MPVTKYSACDDLKHIIYSFTIVEHAQYVKDNYVGVSLFYGQMSYERLEESIAYDEIDVIGRYGVLQLDFFN